MPRRSEKIQVLPILIIAAALAGLLSCSDEEISSTGSEGIANTASAGALVDRPLDEGLNEVLTIAFDAATALPLVPHAKTRSRLQTMVVETMLEAGRTHSAAEAVQQMVGWERGLCYARLACHLAGEGDATLARFYAAKADGIIAELVTSAETQAWRVDRIRVALAEVHDALRDDRRVAELEAGLSASERGRIDVIRAGTLDAAAFDDTLVRLDAVFVAANLDQARAALETYAVLHDRFYADIDRRNALEQRVKESYAKLPLDVRLSLLLRLARQAISHDDGKGALALLDDAGDLMNGTKWLPEAKIPMDATVAALRFRAGAEVEARRSLDDACRRFEVERPRIVDIFRAEALVPLAEAYHDIGDKKSALETYKRALSECVVNPNSRPRAEDLTAICCSIVNEGVRPDEELAEMIRGVRAGLGQPW